ncbi:MAG: hypothetical protein J0H84_02215 [Rhizobiales bacterium]|nr:hypothetical protein [Hyphomicrobiales bacterium]
MDKLAGILNGDGTQAERQASANAATRAGNAALPAELTGAVMTPIGLAGKGVTLAGRFGTDAMTGLKGLLARSGLMAAEGAGYGAANAAGHDQDIKTGALTGAALGAAGNVAAEGVANGINGITNAFKKPAIPSLADLQSAGRAAYDAADNAGVIFSPNAVAGLKSAVSGKLADMGYDPALQPGAAAVVNRINGLEGQNVTLGGLNTLRKVASNGYIPGNKSNNTAISKIIGSIDDLVSNPAAGDVLTGNSQAAADALATARDMWSRSTKAQEVATAVRRGELQAASTGSGGNVDNAIRQKLRRILENPRGYSPDEQAALETAVRGTPTQNVLRQVGKLSPMGNGLMTALGVGGAMVNPSFGIASLTGMGAKAAADAMTKGNVSALDSLIRGGGNAAPRVGTITAAKRALLARALMGGLINQAAPR